MATYVQTSEIYKVLLALGYTLFILHYHSESRCAFKASLCSFKAKTGKVVARLILHYYIVE